MKNKTIVFILGMFLISLISAQTSLGTFKQGEDVVLTQGCINSTYSNITLILFPNSTISMSGQIAMSGDDFYNYTYTNTDTIGQYLVYGYCNEGGTDTAWVYDFMITPNGDELSISNSLLLLFIFFILCFILRAGIIGVNKSLSAEWQIFYICLSYLSLFSITFLFWLTSTNYLYQVPLLANIFWIVWLILGFLFFPFIILISSFLLKKQADSLLADQQGFSPEDRRRMGRR